MPLGDDILRLFGALGPVGLLAALFVIFYLDSIVIPLLPEVFAVLIFQAGGATLEWGLVVLALAEAGEVLGNTTAYVIVRRVGLPARVRRAMEAWTHLFLVVGGLNVAYNPVLARDLTLGFVAAFVAISIGVGWIRKRRPEALGSHEGQRGAP